MASTQALKGRIRSVKSTKQITKAMQLVAASKMRRAQDATKASAPYTDAAHELLGNLASHTKVKSHPLFKVRKVKTRLLIVIASDRGLAGAFNSNLTKLYTQELTKDDKDGIKNTTIAVGRKATQFVARLKDTEVMGSYQDLPDRPGSAALHAILDTARDSFVEGRVDAVDLIYTDYINSVVQKTVVRRVLPAGADITPTNAHQDIAYEPSIAEVLDGVASRLVGAQLYQALLDSRASEYSMRILAMKNATDNASDIIDHLTLEMNKERQSAITQELSEISGGVEALND